MVTPFDIKNEINKDLSTHRERTAVYFAFNLSQGQRSGGLLPILMKFRSEASLCRCRKINVRKMLEKQYF